MCKAGEKIDALINCHGYSILKYKIKKAQSLLLKGFNVNEAAKSVGYDDPFTFSKIFKKHTGISPSKFPEKKGM